MSEDGRTVVEVGGFSGDHLYEYFKILPKLVWLYHIIPSDERDKLGKVYVYTRVANL